MIKEEQLNKLKQLDRIEYLLKLDRLNKKYEGSVFVALIIWFAAYITLGLILFIEGYHIFGIDFAVNLINGMKQGIIIWIITLVLALLFDLFMSYKKNKEENKLVLEFFEVKVKKENK